MRWMIFFVSALVLASGAGAASLQVLEDRYTHAILHAPPAPEAASGRRWREVSCSPETDLTGPGRLLAMAVGESLRKTGIRVNSVVASPGCNAAMTARMLKLVPVDVEEFLAPEPPEGSTAEEQRDEAIVHLAGLRPSDTALLVTHGRNIEELTGLETSPGELVIVSVSPLGEVDVRFSLEPTARP